MFGSRKPIPPIGSRPKSNDSEFREMSDEQLEQEWKTIENFEHTPVGFHTVRALYILRERIRRIEALLAELDGRH